MIRHVVLYTYRKDIPEIEIIKIYKKLGEICKRLPGQLNYTWGKCDPGDGLGLNHGYTHSLVTDFVDTAGQQAFMNDPERVALSKNEVVPRMVNGIESIVSFDFVWNSDL